MDLNLESRLTTYLSYSVGSIFRHIHTVQLFVDIFTFRTYLLTKHFDFNNLQNIFLYGTNGVKELTYHIYS